MPELAPHPHPDLGGYVLGALEPAERADFEDCLLYTSPSPRD